MKKGKKGYFINVLTSEITEVDIKSFKSIKRLLDCKVIERIGFLSGDDIWVDENGLLLDEPKGAFTIRGSSIVISGHGVLIGENLKPCASLDLIRDIISFVPVSQLPEPEITFIPFNSN